MPVLSTDKAVNLINLYSRYRTTDYRMTRFWISLQQGVELVIKALEESKRAVPTGKRVGEGFSYSFGNNTKLLNVEQLQELLKTIVFLSSLNF